MKSSHDYSLVPLFGLPAISRKLSWNLHAEIRPLDEDVGRMKGSFAGRGLHHLEGPTRSPLDEYASDNTEPSPLR